MIVVYSIGSVALFLADAAILKSKRADQQWMKPAAAVQGISVLLGIIAAVVTGKDNYVEYGLDGVALGVIPFAIGFARRKAQRKP